MSLIHVCPQDVIKTTMKIIKRLSENFKKWPPDLYSIIAHLMIISLRAPVRANNHNDNHRDTVHFMSPPGEN